MNKPTYITNAIISYWRYLRMYPIVSLETKLMLRNIHKGDRADILAIDKNKLLTEIEVKSYIKDLERDINKQIHKDLTNKNSHYPVHYFYFAMDKSDEVKALEIINKEFPHAGLLIVQSHKSLVKPDIKIAKMPQRFIKPPLNNAQIMYALKAMSSTLCRLSYKFSKKDNLDITNIKEEISENDEKDSSGDL